MGNCCIQREDRGRAMNFTNDDYLRIKLHYTQANQGHVFDSYEGLDFLAQQQLLVQASQVEPDEINKLYADLVQTPSQMPTEEIEKPKDDVLEPIEQSLVVDKNDLTLEQIDELTNIGMNKICFGKVAVVILAGGQGTRLGFDHPKGMFDINLPSKKTIFQILVERYIRIQMIAHQSPFPSTVIQQCKLLIMTSPINHDETVQYFIKNNYFGARRESVIFFEQAVLPAVDQSGKILMESSSKMTISPNGNGALFDSIKKNKHVQRALKKAEYVQVIGVDNVLNKILDPLLIGYAFKNKLQAVMKSCEKRDAKEPVGVVCKKNQKYDIVEYSELNEQQANAVDDKGKLKFSLGNILIFLLKTEKLFALCDDADSLNQLYHKAFKKVPYWDKVKQELIKPDANNAYKFELFIHNFLPFCDPGKFGVIKVKREEEFAPVKNAEGSNQDSPNTARTLIFNLHTKWLYQNGGELIDDASPQFEIDFLLSYDGENLIPYVQGKKFKSPFYLLDRENH